MITLPKQFLLGRPLRTAQMGETLLPKRLALPVFCSDPLSSVAYATEEILLILALGGAALLHLAWYVAAATLAIMGLFSVTMFTGITALALVYRVHVAGDPAQLGLPSGTAQPTALAQIAKASFGSVGFLFYYVQAFTAGILILAANTAFNGFPLLASILAQDRYLPRQLQNRGDRLVYSNGIVLLALAAIGLIVAFKADVSAIIQLYIVGVFVSFTLSQAGMVRHWQKELATLTDRTARLHRRRSQAINAIGATFTGIVLVIVLITKFTHGAYIVVIAMPLLYAAMKAVHRHYDTVAAELAVPPDARPEPPARNHAIVLVSRIHAPTLRAVGYAKSIHPDSVEAVAVGVDPAVTEALRRQWDAHEMGVPLTVLDSPYREISRPVLDYVRRLKRESPRDLITVIIPEYVPGHWWEQLLHNQSALRLKARLLFTPGVVVTNVPYLLRSAHKRRNQP